MGKVFTTTNAQLKKLRAKGMAISNGSRAKKIIELENYYNLINGYKPLFLKQSGTDETYKEGTRFEEVYALYIFDRELRNLFMRYILEIENNIKSVLAHDFSQKYGSDGYLRLASFDTSVKPWERKTLAQKAGDVSDLISNLQHEIARQLSKNNPMISHHMLEYGHIPLWVLVNTLTLGTVSIFYSYMKQKDQNDIGRKFQLRPNEMNSFLRVLTIYRNACAHDERFYSLKALQRNMMPNNICTLPLHRQLNIPFSGNNNPLNGKNDLFAIVIIFKTMLTKSSFKKFYFSLKKLLDVLSKELSTISVSTVAEAMGFPNNWADIASI